MTAPPPTSPAPPAETRIPPVGPNNPSPPAIPPAGGEAPRVVGLDLSLTATGVASSAGWWTTVGVNDLTTHPLPRRHAELWALGHQILDTIGQPDLVVIEAPAYSRAGAGASERCGLWWRIVHHLTDRDIPVAEVMATTRIRYALGKGVGRKTAIADAVARRWPQYTTGGDDNACDAVVLMAMGMDALGHPIAAMPVAHRKALDAVHWPEAVTAT